MSIPSLLSRFVSAFSTHSFPIQISHQDVETSGNECKGKNWFGEEDESWEQGFDPGRVSCPSLETRAQVDHAACRIARNLAMMVDSFPALGAFGIQPSKAYAKSVSKNLWKAVCTVFKVNGPAVFETWMSKLKTDQVKDRDDLEGTATRGGKKGR